MDIIERKLQKIKGAAMHYLKNAQPTNWRVHIQEIESGTIMYSDGQYRIGRWTFNNEALTLLREADITSEVRRYGMVFEKDMEGQYRVKRDFWEKERFEF